jgi:esterase/lipase
MKKTLLVLLALTSLSTTSCINSRPEQDSVKQYSYTYKFSETDSNVNVHVSYNETSDSFPLVLFLHGSGCGTLEHIHPSSRKYMEGSAAAILTIDKPGAYTGIKQILSLVHCSDAYFKHNTPKSRAASVTQALFSLKKEKLNWNGDVVIVSAHEGAIAAALVAKEFPVKGIVILGTGEGFSEASAFKDVSNCLKEKKTNCNQFQNSAQMLDAAINENTNEKINYRGISGHGKWWNQMLSYNLATLLKDYSGSVLVLHAKKDTTINYESAQKLASFLKTEKKSTVEIKIYDDLDGGFIDSNDKSQKHEIQLDIAKWVKSTLF